MTAITSAVLFRSESGAAVSTPVNALKGKSFNPLDRQLKEKFNQRLKEYKIMCNSKSPWFGTLE